ncbi:hypothetical protein CMQ_6811 [Grosmannia clavigera kw1407]|uniref:Queuosine 5'-phosphate N-glycosylase/hydrolase n=1 Tax=Grosmannia clavigera (strain kw1407 / UAMH 11150) TaxID=655863 RepID=F0X7L0_GROCL|nr:uncharacterized protein CMQ_6811 [Grosmannia clavigera kw1407]EFX06490.1 hypothetical protein CMQ_6811 [Grosmannia clavigera kw1407]
MSDDEADPELLALLRQHLMGRPAVDEDAETGVLEGAEYVCDNAIDVALDMRSCKDAAETIYGRMQRQAYSTATWAEHELHPTARDASTVAFIFTMDLLNFSFWSERPAADRFGIEYRGKTWTGYWSLVAALQRALDEGVPITSSDFWQSEDECDMALMRRVFRSATDEEMPLLAERLDCLRQAGRVLYQKYGCCFTNVLAAADGSAARLVNILARDFACFRDEFPYPGRRRPIRFLKRAQILVAELWACFQGTGYGAFHDIDKLTMFADYRVPQILHSLGCLYYSPPLLTIIRQQKPLASGSDLEMQLRACTIWCVELIRREIVRNHPDAKINAVLIDFFLYDTMKELEAASKDEVPHHRTRSIWY